MRDGRTKRALGRASGVDMDPLWVPGGSSERVDVCLAQRDPCAHTEVPPHKGVESFQIGTRHGSAAGIWLLGPRRRSKAE